MRLVKTAAVIASKETWGAETISSKFCLIYRSDPFLRTMRDRNYLDLIQSKPLPCETQNFVVLRNWSGKISRKTSVRFATRLLSRDQGKKCHYANSVATRMQFQSAFNSNLYQYSINPTRRHHCAVLGFQGRKQCFLSNLYQPIHTGKMAMHDHSHKRI